MARAVAVTQTYPGSVHEAETCWYDVSRWPEWVEGLAEVIDVSGDWPQVGSSVTWQSGPAGRGRVVERVAEYDPLSGLVTDVQDDSIRGRQSVGFLPAGEGQVEVTLMLRYELRQRSLFAWLGSFFIRRAMRESLADTLGRFGPVLEASRRRLG